MSRATHFIELTPELAHILIAELQVVLEGEASYFHAELWTEGGERVGLHLAAPAERQDGGGPDHG